MSQTAYCFPPHLSSVDSKFSDPNQQVTRSQYESVTPRSISSRQSIHPRTCSLRSSLAIFITSTRYHGRLVRRSTSCTQMTFPPGNRPGTRVGTDPVPPLPDLRPLQDVALFRFEFVAVPFSGRPDPAGSHVVTCLALQVGPYRNMARTAAHVDAFCPALSGAAPSDLPRPRITARLTTCEEQHPFRVRTASVRCQK